MSVQKRYRQGQILKLLAAHAVVSQDELRRHLGHIGMRVTQKPTLLRDLRELRLVKTAEGYRSLSAAAAEEAAPQKPRPGAGAQGIPARHSSRKKHACAENSSGRCAATRCGGGFRTLGRRIVGTLAGDDTVSAHCDLPQAPGQRCKSAWRNCSDERPFTGSPSSEQRATRDMSWPGSFFGTQKSTKPTFLSPREPERERALPDGTLPATARAGAKRHASRYRLEAIVASGADVAFLSTPHEASLELVPQLLAANPKTAYRGFERRVSFSRAGDL